MRLYQGNYDKETVYGDDPAAMAQRWQSLGATRLHVVDLDGARDGRQVNAAAVKAIVAAVQIPVELGGGVRDLETISRWLNLGIERVYLGTAAVTNPELVAEACALYPKQIAAGADAKDGLIAVRGWEEASGESVIDFARRVVAAGVVAISYTDIARDGTLDGPNLDHVPAILAALPSAKAQFILAGGIGSLDDIARVAAFPGIDAVIVGRALYEGTVDLTEARELVTKLT